MAQATSSAGGGFVGIWGGGYLPPWREEEIELERYGLDFYARLAGEGYDLKYKRNGNLWAATTQEAWERYVAVIADHEAVPERRVLDPREVEEVTSIIPAKSVVGGVLFPNGCQVSAPKSATATAARFVEPGGRVDVRRPVERLVVANGRVTGIETLRGRISTDVVVVAAGAWTNVLLRELGVFVPIVPLVQSRIDTPRGRLVSIPIATAVDRSTWTELLAESEAVLHNVTRAGDRLVLSEIVDGYPVSGSSRAKAIRRTRCPCRGKGA